MGGALLEIGAGPEVVGLDELPGTIREKLSSVRRGGPGGVVAFYYSEGDKLRGAPRPQKGPAT